MQPGKVGNIWIRMSTRRITNAIAREERAAARAEQSVLRRQRDLNEIKVNARKTTTRIKIVLGGDGLAFEQGRISLEEFQRRAARGRHELREVNEALANIGLRSGDGQTNTTGEISPPLAPAPQDAAPKPKKKIVRFYEKPPDEFRRKLREELKLNYDPDSIYWYGEVDPARVESFIRRQGLWDLVRFFNGAAGSP
jgi:hypothetical protein